MLPAKTDILRNSLILFLTGLPECNGMLYFGKGITSMRQLKSEQEIKEFNAVLEPYLSHPKIREMDQYNAHGSVSVLEHSMNVAAMAYRLDRLFGKKADLEVLLPGALLHDFYLYDWHDKPLSIRIFRMHGYTHPSEACRNAAEIFQEDEKTQEVIRCHMWPLTLRSIPRHREAILVCIADKLCALTETLKR